MDVRVRLADGLSAEVYSVHSNGTVPYRRLGLFFYPDTPEEEEAYVDSVEDSLRLFEKKSGVLPHRKKGVGSR